jgi:hypothetical protein
MFLKCNSFTGSIEMPVVKLRCAPEGYVSGMDKAIALWCVFFTQKLVMLDNARKVTS